MQRARGFTVDTQGDGDVLDLTCAQKAVDNPARGGLCTVFVLPHVRRHHDQYAGLQRRLEPRCRESS
jgi:hypothetical protein